MDNFVYFLLILITLILILIYFNEKIKIIMRMQDRNRDIAFKVMDNVLECHTKVLRGLVELQQMIQDNATPPEKPLDVLGKPEPQSDFRDPVTGLLSYKAFRQNVARKLEEKMTHEEVEE